MGLRDRRKEGQENTITVDSAMQGSLSFKEPVRLSINGKFEGTLEVRGVLEVGPGAVVDATIAGDDIVIAGKVKGDIVATHKIILREHAVVEGNLKTPLLSIAEGALFQGRCVMLGDIFDTDALAKYLEVDMGTVLEWASAGKIPAFRDGSTWKFERKKIDEWVSTGRVS